MIAGNAAMRGYYDYNEVAKSVFIAILASWAALDLAGRVTVARGWARFAWLAGGATALGLGIWAMHFKGMLAFHLPVPIAYHWPTVLLSLVIAILASAFALYLASRTKLGVTRALIGSVVMGSGIAALHYTAMAAMRLPAVIEFNFSVVALSLVFAIAFSFAALVLAFDLREETKGIMARKIGSAVVMGAAVSAMHYTGMAAASFTAVSAFPNLSHAVSISPVGNNAIAIVTVVVLLSTMLTSSIDRKVQVELRHLNEELERRVSERTSQLTTLNAQLTEREARLREYEKAMEGLEEMIVVVDRNYRCVLANRAYLKYRNMGREQLAGRLVPEVLNPGVFESVVKSKLDECFEGKVVRYELRYNYPHLGERDLLMSYFPVEGATGIDRAACILQDITERKRAEKSLQLFRILLDHSNDAIEVIDPETLRFLDINQRACVELGYTREELLCMTVYDIDPAVDEAKLQKVATALERSGFVVFESVHRRKDGSTFPVEVSAKQVQLDRAFRVSVVRDITERKRVEEALRKAQAEADRGMRIAAMGELTASIAHEINQPLGAVVADASAAARWLAQVPPNLEEGRKAMARTVAEANRASNVIARVRGLLRKAPPQTEPFDLNATIRESLALIEHERQRFGVTVESDLAAGIPPAHGDRVQIQQLVLNLIMNAFEAMATVQSRPRTLRIRTALHPKGIVVDVEDSGVGIDPEQQERFFEPFFTTKPHGIGMGLAIGRSIIEGHGGLLWFTPGVDHGAIFHFTLPTKDVNP